MKNKLSVKSLAAHSSWQLGIGSLFKSIGNIIRNPLSGSWNYLA